MKPVQECEMRLWDSSLEICDKDLYFIVPSSIESADYLYQLGSGPIVFSSILSTKDNNRITQGFGELKLGTKIYRDGSIIYLSYNEEERFHL